MKWLSKDKAGNDCILMEDGATVSCPEIAVNVNLQLTVPMQVSDRMVIVPIADALRIARAAQDYWYQKAKRLEAELADYRSQANGGG